MRRRGQAPLLPERKMTMAERRMFTMKIVDSDAFLEMPTSAQALYFHLNMRADDDGFLNNPRKIMAYVGASPDDLRLLITKRFLLVFESGVIVIKHWRMHNTLRRDRYTPTQYQELFAQLGIKENGSYTDHPEAALPSGNQLATTWQPNGNQMATQDSIGKDSVGEVSIGKDREEKETTLSLSERKKDTDTLRTTKNVQPEDAEAVSVFRSFLEREYRNFPPDLRKKSKAWAQELMKLMEAYVRKKREDGKPMTSKDAEAVCNLLGNEQVYKRAEWVRFFKFYVGEDTE
jgi:hypothetical protein